ncbi:hypothetical protein FRC11_009880 [Ceratobasidium sp. 423]|nr:hypothetical protein FRC11_009880 [Ceratobasidium sp. 423]
MVKGNHDDLYAPDPAPAPAPAPTVPPCTQAPASQEPEGSQVGGNIAIDPKILQDPLGAPSTRPEPRSINTTGLPVAASITQAYSAIPSALPPNPQDVAHYPRAPDPPQELHLTATMDPPDHEPLPPIVPPGYDIDIWLKGPPMPIPPTLSQQECDTAAAAAVAAPELPAKIKKSPSNLATVEAPNPTEEPVPAKPKQGHPKGSKNLKTLEKERLAAEAAMQHEEGE